MDKNLYNYKAELLEVIDGDTIDISIDLGFDISIKERVRIYNIDTPECRTKNPLEKEAGLKVKQDVERRIIGKELFVKTIKEKGKYGRYVADVYVRHLDSCISISDFLVWKKFAKVYDGIGKREEWTTEELEYIINN
jgi:micrococcal nuclease